MQYFEPSTNSKFNFNHPFNFDTENFGRGQKQNFNQKGTKKKMNEANPEDPSHLSLFGPLWHYYGKSDCQSWLHLRIEHFFATKQKERTKMVVLKRSKYTIVYEFGSTN